MPSTSWELRLRALMLFVAGEHREPAVKAATPGERRLALWLQEQRQSARAGRLAVSRTEALRSAGLLQGDDGARVGAAWLKVASVSRFIAEEGRLPGLGAGSSVGERRLAAWLRIHLASPAGSSDVAEALRRILAEASIEPDQALASVG